MDSAADTPCGVGCPIRRSRAQSLLAAPPGFSQRATSFVASWRQGIHQMPLLSSTPASDNRTTPASLATCRGPRPRRRTAPTKTGVSSGGRRRRKAIPATTTVPQSLVYPPRRPEAARRQAYPCQMRALPEDGKTKSWAGTRDLPRCPPRTLQGAGIAPAAPCPCDGHLSSSPPHDVQTAHPAPPSRAGGLAAGRRGSLPGGRARPGPREPAPSP